MPVFEGKWCIPEGNLQKETTMFPLFKSKTCTHTMGHAEDSTQGKPEEYVYVTGAWKTFSAWLTVAAWQLMVNSWNLSKIHPRNSTQPLLTQKRQGEEWGRADLLRCKAKCLNFMIIHGIVIKAKQAFDCFNFSGINKCFYAFSRPHVQQTAPARTAPSSTRWAP